MLKNAALFLNVKKGKYFSFSKDTVE